MLPTTTTKPFLVLQLRTGNTESDDEFNAFVRYGTLQAHEVKRVRMEAGNLPTVTLDDYSGVLVGGGPWNVSDPTNKKPEEQRQAEAWLIPLMKDIIARDFPYLGMCYGLGILAHALGSTVSKARYGEAVGGVALTRTRDAQDDPLLTDVSTSFKAFCGHKEAVQVLPAQSTLLVSGSVCPVQMIRVGTNVYATQFHTELDADSLALRIRAYKDLGYFEPHEADGLIEMGYHETVHEPMHILRRFVEVYRTPHITP